MLACGAALAVVCGACGSPLSAPHNGTPGASSSTTSSAPTGTRGSTSTSKSTSTSTTATTASLATCSFGQLQVSAGQQGAALGHEGGPILFENIGASPCSLQGYPGVAGLSTTGAQAVQAQWTPQGYMGGLRSSSAKPPLVVLGSHDVASALVEGTDNPIGDETTCPTYHKLLVTPPTSTQSATVAFGVPGCSRIQVHPVVPGATGSETG